MYIFEKIISESKKVNDFWNKKNDDYFENVKIDFGKYFLSVEENFSFDNFPQNAFYFFDKNLKLSHENSIQLLASESKTKNIDFIHSLISEHSGFLLDKVLVAVGGGVILDTVLCIGKILNLKVIFVPTTILSMSDSSIGSKARANKVTQIEGKEVFIKHFYREYYDPEEIVVCENFLKTIPDAAILFSCAEIIKMAFFQSEDLLNFLLSEGFSPFSDKKSLLKAILWAADLKRICMEVDPNETIDGSKKIIREGHVFADKLEKESGFTISHGEAVLRGIEKDLEEGERLPKFLKLCEKLRAN